MVRLTSPMWASGGNADMACIQSRLGALLHGAGEARRLIDVPGPAVTSHPRMRAERTGPHGLSVHDARSHDQLGRHLPLDPVLHRRQHVELVHSRTAAAV